HVEIFIKSDDGELLEIRDQFTLISQLKHDLLDSFSEVKRGFAGTLILESVIELTYLVVVIGEGSNVFRIARRISKLFLNVDELVVSVQCFFIPASSTIELGEFFKSADCAVARLRLEPFFVFDH